MKLKKPRAIQMTLLTDSCLSQVAAVAETKIPKISDHMRYEDTWQLDHYKEQGVIDQADAQPVNSADPKSRAAD